MTPPLTVEGGHTVQVLWCVLDHPLSHVVVLHTVNGRGLEPSPAEGEDEWVT